jgi:hypothetical protein
LAKEGRAELVRAARNGEQLWRWLRTVSKMGGLQNLRARFRWKARGDFAQFTARDNPRPSKAKAFDTP